VKKIFFILVLALSCAALGQDQQSGGSADEQAKPARRAIFAGQGTPSSFGELLSPRLSFGGSLGFIQRYDDNVFNTNATRENEWLAESSARFSMGYEGRRSRFQLNYLPSYSQHYHYDGLNFFSQSLDGSYSYALTRHTDVNANIGFSRVPSHSGLPFSTLNAGGVGVVGNDLQALDSTVNILSQNSRVSIGHQFSERLRAVVAVNATHVDFQPITAGAAPISLAKTTYSFGGTVNVDYTLGKNDLVGLLFTNEYFGFLSPNQHQQYQSAEVTYQRKLPMQLHLEVGVGPSITEQARRDPAVGTAAHASLSRPFGRTTLGVNFSRSQAPGLLQDSLTSYSLGFNATRHFGERWNTSLAGSYSRSISITAAGNLNYYSAVSQIGYELGQGMMLNLNYGYLAQQSTASAASRNVSRNQFAAGMTYRFGTSAEKSR
jgi:hypothetical protein